MFKGKEIRKIKNFKILFLILVLVITLTYITRKGEFTAVSDTANNVWKKPNFFQWHIKDPSKEKTALTSEPKTNYPEAELDIKVSPTGILIGKEEFE